jgi:hypothetical protein
MRDRSIAGTTKTGAAIMRRMPNVASALEAEISRLARKETNLPDVPAGST